MDEFDQFNPTSQTLDEENTNIQKDNLSGSGHTDDTIAETPINTFSSEQQEDSSWIIENNSPNTTTQFNILGDDNLDNLPSIPQATLFDDDIFTNQSNTNDFDSYSTNNLPPTANDILYNDTTRQQIDSPSFNMFSNPVSSLISTNTINQLNSTEISSTENLSVLQAFNIHRQQEIAEKAVEEKQKIEELRQQAKQDLERWYKERNTRMEQKRQTIKHEENLTVTKSLEKSDKNSCDWSKVIRFIEFSQGTQVSKGKRDLNRMRSVIIQAKRDKDNRLSENGV